MALDSATEIAGAGNYPTARLRQRERKVLELATAGSAPQVASGTITAAEMLALNATPKLLIAAPGAGKTIIVDEIQLFLDYNSAAYAGIASGEDLAIRYATGDTNIVLVETTGFLDATADVHKYCQPSKFAVGATVSTPIAITTVDNEGIEIALEVGEITTGDSPLKWEIRYHVVTQLT
jgi:hypothetical protein